ncbi:restriction endonuclease subunit S [Pelotomaculum isophthalicicum JI]|uniref:Restriction endonuclease subunit S n=1 Tax=Pelotomaculum isophthalicicum JI TaxID=947010 RepID=A0A9X4JVL1_9FIRM|nr:restriction endonuclease subunit S [Pelotomaculum isophthalicicum]MDF9407587.1 restriction endonuclease subunit S [Pelotomaculum isophthalicicum JI]
MSEWREYNLGSVIDIHDSKRIPLSTMQREKRKGVYPYYGAQGIIDYIDDYIFDGSYLLIAEDGENLKSRQSNVAFQVKGQFWVNNHAHIVSSNELSNQALIYYILNSIDLDQYITGSAQPKLNQEMLRSIIVTLPPRPIQDAIAEVLSSLDDKVDLLTRQNATLEALAQTYYRQWFIEDNDNNTIPVSQIATLENNSINPARQPLEPFYHYSIPAFDNAQTPAVELGKTILSNKFIVPPNVILVSKLNPITPRVWRIDKHVKPNSVCSTEFQVLKPHNEKHYLFLYCLMKSKDVVSSFAMSTTGTSGSHQRIRPEYILEIETPEPDEKRLIEFNEIMTPMMDKVSRNQAQILTLQKLRDTLLPKLISGEVRVKQ